MESYWNKIMLFVALCLCCHVAANAQKKVLDHTVYDAWKRLENLSVSSKGNVLSYEVQPQEGDGLLVIENRRTKGRILVSRGTDFMVTPDEKFAVCVVKPLFADVRKAKIKKTKAENMPKDSLFVFSLNDGKTVRFAHVLSSKMAQKGNDAIAFAVSDTALIPKSDRKRKNIGKPLIVYHFGTGKCDTLKYVEHYDFDRTGKSLALVLADSVHRQCPAVVDIATMKTNVLIGKTAFVSLPEFDEQGAKLLFLASKDTLSEGSKKCDLYLYDRSKSSTQLLADSSSLKKLPAGWSVNQYSSPCFSLDSKRVFVGVAPVIPPNDTTLVPFETAGLDLWSTSDARIQPAQLNSLKADLKRTFPAVVDMEHKQLLPLTVSEFDRVAVLNGGNSGFVLSEDRTKDIISMQWDIQVPVQLSLYNPVSADRKLMPSGRFSDVRISPDGKYVVWYNLTERNWFLYNVEKTSVVNLTAKSGVNFWDEDDDRPQLPEPYGFCGWSKDGKSVFLNDRFDVWKFSLANAAATNLTASEGRKTNRVFRLINAVADDTKKYPSFISNDKDVFDLSGGLLFTVFDRTTKKNGYATLKSGAKGKLLINVLDGYTFAQLRKASDSNIFVYQKACFNTSPDAFVTRDAWKTEQKLSDINPQMKDYAWGSVELVKWKAFDGTELEGLLYKPENFDSTKKYPLISYFYEKHSEKLYAYYPPSPSRSIINIAFYCSRGYVVFVPDIVYKTGQPGESAYNCIVSGVEEIAKNTWVDKERMGIQGQSWGGYQVAYLVTRTNLFKAAGSGAPVSNMTSAYGGIRWESGSSRQFQYEHTQSRIGKTLWEAPELYISNSPLFRADKVETPLLIMSNDADGAVPYYQGIEYFMALRRLGKQAWLLQYNNEAHNLTERRNMKDLTIRLQQFFDYYLKGEPMPAWMKSGIPAIRKGRYFGFENAR